MQNSVKNATMGFNNNNVSKKINDYSNISAIKIRNGTIKNRSIFVQKQFNPNESRITSSHVLMVDSNNCTQVQVIANMKQAAEKASSILGPKCNPPFNRHFIVNTVAPKGNYVGYSLIFVADSRFYNLLIGLNPDGSRRIKKIKQIQKLNKDDYLVPKTVSDVFKLMKKFGYSEIIEAFPNLFEVRCIRFENSRKRRNVERFNVDYEDHQEFAEEMSKRFKREVVGTELQFKRILLDEGNLINYQNVPFYNGESNRSWSTVDSESEDLQTLCNFELFSKRLSQFTQVPEIEVSDPLLKLDAIPLTEDQIKHLESVGIQDVKEHYLVFHQYHRNANSEKQHMNCLSADITHASELQKKDFKNVFCGFVTDKSKKRKTWMSVTTKQNGREIITKVCNEESYPIISISTSRDNRTFVNVLFDPESKDALFASDFGFPGILFKQHIKFTICEPRF